MVAFLKKIKKLLLRLLSMRTIIIISDILCRLLAIAVFIWITYKNQGQQAIAIFSLLVAIIGVEKLNDLMLAIIDKIQKITRLKYGNFEASTEIEKPEDLKNIDDETFHRLVAAGKNYLAENFIKESIKCFEDALKIKPNNSGLHLILSFVYGERIGNKKKAIDHCKSALKIDPSSVNAQFNLAVYTNHLKGYKYSLPIYKRAEELIKQENLTDQEIYGKLNLFIGHDLRDTGEKSEAENRYKEAISIFKKLVEQGDETSKFWLRNAEKNLNKLNKEMS